MKTVLPYGRLIHYRPGVHHVSDDCGPVLRHLQRVQIFHQNFVEGVEVKVDSAVTRKETKGILEEFCGNYNETDLMESWWFVSLVLGIALNTF